MSKVYFIDSENVGDFWLPLIDVAAPEDVLLVFYTRNSPHMNYENVIRLKESGRDVTFIKCFEGTNALDFQLVTELGYRLKGNEDSMEAVIVTNDTGFDAVVKYWSQRNRLVKRITGKECHYLKKELSKSEKAQASKMKATETSKEPSFEAPVMEVEVVSSKDAEALSDAEAVLEILEVSAADREGSVEEAGVEMEISPDKPEKPVSIAGEKAEALASEADAGKAGQQADPADAGKTGQQADPADAGKTGQQADQADAGKTGQQADQADAGKSEPQPEETENGASSALRLTEEQMKEVQVLVSCLGKSKRPDLHNCLALIFGDEGKEIYQSVKLSVSRMQTERWSQKKKFEQYCQIVFAHSEYAGEEPEDFAEYLYKVGDKRKNLNSLRSALQNQYGKDKGMKYYSLFKTHIKLMNHF